MFREVELRSNHLLLYHISIYKYINDLATNKDRIKIDSTMCGIKDIHYLSDVYEAMFYNSEIGEKYYIENAIRTCKKCIEKLH